MCKSIGQKWSEYGRHFVESTFILNGELNRQKNELFGILIHSLFLSGLYSRFCSEEVDKLFGNPTVSSKLLLLAHRRSIGDIFVFYRNFLGFYLQTLFNSVLSGGSRNINIGFVPHALINCSATETQNVPILSFIHLRSVHAMEPDTRRCVVLKCFHTLGNRISSLISLLKFQLQMGKKSRNVPIKQQQTVKAKIFG